MPLTTPRPRARVRFAVFASAALLAAVAITGARPAAAQSAFNGTAGSGSYRYFFALDFRDFATPQFYAFEYRSSAAQLSFADVLNGLTSVPTFTLLAHDFPPFGLSLDGLGFAGKEKHNDFGGNNSGEPNGYWSQWNSLTGVTWQSNNSGISGQMVSAGKWVGASWTADFNTVTDAAPRVTPAAIAAAGTVPEPGTLGLLALGLAGGVGGTLARRRKR